jgi:hypothetical protein
MNDRIFQIVLTSFLTIVISVPLNAEELGRLFFSVAERQQLEAKPASKNAPIKPAAKIINGIIQRSDGGRLVWLNGKLQPPTDTDAQPTGSTLSTQSLTFSDLKVGRRHPMITTTPATNNLHIEP